ncbi:hypothetical protein CCACVL1_24348 [Corchorus capsularis]|uniref:Uncharacterized protein n=1 Tax=Corchorus capsularis TaxID=210143 RepID=A0A1R3GQ29_COCAP|nr:hypothetical protein CCACVL1_24348 [Corchorus capsularis]
MAKKFRKQGCPMFDKLCIIYGDTTASGFNARPSTHSPSDSDEDARDQPIREEDARDQPLSDEDGIIGDVTSGSRRRASSSRLTGKRAKNQNALTTILNSYNENTKRKVEVW